MQLAERLRALDNTLLGTPKPVNPRGYRNGFLLGLLGLVTFFGTALVVGQPQILTYTGAVLILTALNGYEWARTRQHAAVDAAQLRRVVHPHYGAP